MYTSLHGINPGKELHVFALYYILEEKKEVVVTKTVPVKEY